MALKDRLVWISIFAVALGIVLIIIGKARAENFCCNPVTFICEDCGACPRSDCLVVPPTVDCNQPKHLTCQELEECYHYCSCLRGIEKQYDCRNSLEPHVYQCIKRGGYND